MRVALLLLVVLAAFLAGAAPPIVDPATGEAASAAFKIFFFHVPSAYTALLVALPISAFSSGAFLATGRKGFDAAARGAAEVGLLFATAVLVSGPLWAKAAWGVFWTWEPRLATFLVLWIAYLGYHLFRAAIEDPALAGRRAAVYNLLAFVTVPFVHFSISLWGRISHPPAAGDYLSDPSIAFPFYLNLASFVLLALHFIARRAATFAPREASSEAAS